MEYAAVIYAAIMRAKVVLAALMAVVAVAGCSSSQGSRSAAGLESGEMGGSADPFASTNVQSSLTRYLRLENQLRAWWNDGIPITWKVTDTYDRDWGSGTRPDNPPPQGLQGLVQPAYSGELTLPLDIDTTWNTNARFTLTPIVSIDGREYELVPIRVYLRYYDMYVNTKGFYWSLDAGGSQCKGPSTPTFTGSVTTPSGLVVYDYILDCAMQTIEHKSKIIIREYQKP